MEGLFHMSATAYSRINYTPAEGTKPEAHLSPYAKSPVGIPVLRLSGRHGSQDFQVSLGEQESELDDSVRYLRELAEQATRLADQIEQDRAAREGGA
jgi:hypothetical protein